MSEAKAKVTKLEPTPGPEPATEAPVARKVKPTKLGEQPKVDKPTFGKVRAVYH